MAKHSVDFSHITGGALALGLTPAFWPSEPRRTPAMPRSRPTSSPAPASMSARSRSATMPSS